MKCLSYCTSQEDKNSPIILIYEITQTPSLTLTLQTVVVGVDLMGHLMTFILTSQYFIGG